MVPVLFHSSFIGQAVDTNSAGNGLSWLLLFIQLRWQVHWGAPRESPPQLTRLGPCLRTLAASHGHGGTTRKGTIAQGSTLTESDRISPPASRAPT
jgi:hypothetical protein